MTSPFAPPIRRRTSAEITHLKPATTSPSDGPLEDLIRAKVATEAVSARGAAARALTYAPDPGFVMATVSGFAAVLATVLGFATIAGG
ncbi:MAG: hypothetical protein ACQEW8_01205 [Actinomycetota bacterium]